MPHVKKASSNTKLQQPKVTSHFGNPVVQHGNDSKGLEYSDSDDQDHMLEYIHGSVFIPIRYNIINYCGRFCYIG